MDFDIHTFISYAHVDNVPVIEGQQGWVTRFHSTLSAMLTQRMGEQAEIWRDQKLSGNDEFSAEILLKLPRSALLIAILTPRYVRSNWCHREIHEFCEMAEKNGGLVIQNKCRVFKILKNPIERNAELPEIIDKMLGYEFYTMDGERPVEFDPSFGEQFKQQFLLSMNKLAWDIAQLHERMRKHEEKPAQPAEAAARGADAAKPTVYLAHVGADRRVAREMIQADLQFHGYDVLPENQPASGEGAYIEETAAALDQCALSIHLIGNDYGEAPGGADAASVVMLQNEIAAIASRKRKLPRIIWLPDDVKPSHPHQANFVNALRRDASMQDGADLLTEHLEVLKSAIHGKLRELREREARPEPANLTQDKAVVHVLMDPRDASNVIPLVKLLKAHGLAVTFPVFSGDAASVREANTLLLRDCHAVLLYYGAGDEAWMFHQRMELSKQAAFRDHALVLYTCLAEPDTPSKMLLRETQEPHCIDGRRDLSEADLVPFIEATLACAGREAA
jgi:hypothetical protein